MAPASHLAHGITGLTLRSNSRCHLCVPYFLPLKGLTTWLLQSYARAARKYLCFGLNATKCSVMCSFWFLIGNCYLVFTQMFILVSDWSLVRDNCLRCLGDWLVMSKSFFHLWHQRSFSTLLLPGNSDWCRGSQISAWSRRQKYWGLLMDTGGESFSMQTLGSVILGKCQCSSRICLTLLQSCDCWVLGYVVSLE